MNTYSQFKPTGFDPAGAFLPERQDWFVCEVARNRDSGIRSVSNFESSVKILEGLDPEGNDHEVHRFGHWGNGWFEIILVRPGTEAAKEADKIEAALCDYPILDDSDYSDRENQAIEQYWFNCTLKERVELCSKYNASIFAARRDSVPNDDVYSYIRDRID